MLLVDLAYHSPFMTPIAEHFEDLLVKDCGIPLPPKKYIAMFSSVNGRRIDQECDARYWKSNMVSPVHFSQAVQEMLSEGEALNILIEIGPSGALAGPLSQIKTALAD